MGFLDTVKQAGAVIQREGRVSQRALQREFNLDDAQLNEVVAELVDVRGVATADGDVLVAANAAVTASTDTDRRDLTVLFCDLVGSTELSTRLDSEDYGAAIRVYHDAVTAVVARFGGFVAQLLGDGLLVLFGYPEASEDSAEQAVRAALEIVRVVDALPSDLSVRVGLHSGPCVIRTVGAGGRHDTVVLGETPNIAARVQAIAEAGAVVMTAATQRLVAGWFVVEGAGSHDMKGVPQPIAVHRVISVSAVGSPLEVHRERGSGPFVGRDRERKLLFDAWDRAARGSGHAVHICGEPGIGKSRLAIELREHLRGRPHATLGASCTRYVRNTAFHPVHQIVERVVGFTPDDEPGRRVVLVQDALRAADFDTDEMLALLCSFLAVPHASAGVLGELSPEARRRRTIDGLVELLVAFSAREPIAVLIEDLHWCDPSSLEVVARVVDRVATERILLVTTSRPEFTPAWAASANVAVVNLEPVTKRAATELVDAVLDGWDAREAVRRTIVERAEGNPLFLEELSQMVLESDDATAIPSTLQSSLLARLDRLGSAKFFAQVAAVIGREFSRDMLRLVVAAVPHAVAIGELDDALEQLTANGLILRRSRDRYVFKHALVQDAAIHSLLRTTRGELHRSVVRVLRDEFPARIAAQPELAARHAEAGGLVDEAIAWYEQASEHARARSEHEEALALLYRAIELLVTETESPERDRREIALQQTLTVELFQSRGYSVPEALAALERVRNLAQARDDMPSYSGAVTGLGLAAYTSCDFDRAEPLVLEGLAVAERVGSIPHMVAALGTYSLTLFFRGRFRAALEAAERAVSLYDPVLHHRAQVGIAGDDSGVSSLATSGWTLLHLGYPEQGLARCDDAVRLANSLDSPFTVVQAKSWRLAQLDQLRDETMEEQADLVRRFCDEQGFPAFGAAATIFLARARDDLDLMIEAVSAMAATGAVLLAPAACCWLAEAYAVHRRYDEARATLNAGLDMAVGTGQHFFDSPLHRVKGEVVLADENISEAERHKSAEDELREAIDIAQRQESMAFELHAATELARLLLAQQRPADALGCLEPIYSSYTEGFDTRSLRDARSLLTRVSATGQH